MQLMLPFRTSPLCTSGPAAAQLPVGGHHCQPPPLPPLRGDPPFPQVSMASHHGDSRLQHRQLQAARWGVGLQRRRLSVRHWARAGLSVRCGRGQRVEEKVRAGLPACSKTGGRSGQVGLPVRCRRGQRGVSDSGQMKRNVYFKDIRFFTSTATTLLRGENH